LFGTVSALMITHGPVQSAAVIAVFVAGEMGGTSVLCSLIVRQFRRGLHRLTLLEAVAGYAVSHFTILTSLHMSAAAGRAPAVSGQSTLAWMELTLWVDLAAVLASTAAVLCEPRLRKFAELQIRKFIAAA